MSLSMTVFVFINAWWVSVFLALPWSIEPGEGAAPRRINWLRIVVVTTLLAVFFTAALALTIKSGIIPVRDSYQ